MQDSHKITLSYWNNKSDNRGKVVGTFLFLVGQQCLAKMQS